MKIIWSGLGVNRKIDNLHPQISIFMGGRGEMFIGRPFGHCFY